MRGVNKRILVALAETGLPYRLEYGRGDHVKIRLGGRLVGICRPGDADVGPASRNTVAQIRRAAREMANATNAD